MVNKNVLDEIGAKISEIVAHSPAKDIERNMRAMMTSMLSRLDVVTREEFDVQQEVLKRTRAKLTELEEKVAALESQLKPASSDTGAGDTNYEG
ncbi:accessory factor UbiK family protein [Nitrosomonas communis]|uniref:accessory factor UbiK family protein n=1 Tax=Nitrosomonas communis TaxID=44574 RepID=UPI0026F2A7A9|nr:accessory factor UbiK family protein [Nitrosomonas communis]MCO6428451.1 accessory factor UbiK family protein [Nitrosomonas communis]